MDRFIDRVDARLRELNISREAASKRAGLTRDFLRNFARPSHKEMKPRAENLYRLAEVLECSPDYLIGVVETPDLKAPNSKSDFVRLPIAHRVEAGSWHEVDEIDEPRGWRTVPAHPSFPHARQWLEEVVGDSMDLLIRPGSLVHVIDIEDAGYVPVDGDIVVVVRTRAGFLERTLKQLVIERADDGRMIRSLVPRSNNPRYTAPVMREGDDPDPGTEQVEIVGLVVQDFRIWK